MRFTMIRGEHRRESYITAICLLSRFFIFATKTLFRYISFDFSPTKNKREMFFLRDRHPNSTRKTIREAAINNHPIYRAFFQKRSLWTALTSNF